MEAGRTRASKTLEKQRKKPRGLILGFSVKSNPRKFRGFERLPVRNPLPNNKLFLQEMQVVFWKGLMRLRDPFDILLSVGTSLNRFFKFGSQPDPYFFSNTLLNGEAFDLVLVRFAMERLLYRLSQSTFRDRFNQPFFRPAK
jgi:hypothetical protein